MVMSFDAVKRRVLKECKNHKYATSAHSPHTALPETNSVDTLIFVLVGGQFKVQLSWEQNQTAEGKYDCGLLKSWDDSLPTIHTEG